MAKDEPLDDKLDEERDEDGQIYVDRDKIDFDPDDGLLSGTAFDGTSEIPGSEDNDGDSEGNSGGEPQGNADSESGDTGDTEADKSEDNAVEGEHDKDS